MAVAKIAISLPVPLVTRIDRLAKKSGLSRSAVVREVVERTLNEYADTEVVRKARHIYAQIGEEDRALADTFLSFAAETFPSWHKRRGESWPT